MDSRIKKLEQILKNDRFAARNDIQLVSVGKGVAIAEMVVSEKHYFSRFCVCSCFKFARSNCGGNKCEY